MTSIQGTAPTAASHLAARPQAAPAAKSEFGESALTERQEAVAGTQEVGEASSTVGTRFSTTA